MDKLALKAFLLKIERESIGKAELNYSEYLEEIRNNLLSGKLIFEEELGFASV